MDQQKDYIAALQSYLEGAGENALEEAYALGRKALEQGIGAMELAIFHHDALSAMRTRLKPSTDAERSHMFELAGKFLAECLSPFEMAQRGFLETIAAQKSLNERLEEEVQIRTRALRESEERYRKLIQMSPDGITVTDMQGRITLSNQQVAQMHGFNGPEEEVGIDAGQFVSPEDMDRVRAMSQQVRRTGTSSPIEYMMLRRNGETIPVEARVTFMEDADGQGGSFIGIVRDITQRREAEMELKTKARQQAAVSTLGQMALADTDIGQLMDLTCALVTQTLDVEFCELLEMLPDGDSLILRDGIGWKEGSVNVTTVRTQANSQAGFTLLSAAPVIVDDLPSETRFIPPALLTEHGILSGVTVIIHSDGQPYGVLGAHTDYHRAFTIEESHFLQSMANTLAMAFKNRRLLESEAARREAAERAYEERLRQLAIINHELRTPLASIKGFATTLLADDVVWSPTDQADFIQTINDEADKLSRLVEQVLEVSKMDAGRVPIELTRQDLSAIVDRAKGQMNAVTGNHDFAMHIPDNLPPVMADSQRTGQILVNLVENAVKYSPEGTSIRLTVRPEGDFIHVSVSDQGRGIAPEDRKKVFQAFYRSSGVTSGAMKAKGVGLGLHICQRLVEAQGGKIEIMDHEGPGTTISFTIPLAVTSEQEEINK